MYHFSTKLFFISAQSIRTFHKTGLDRKVEINKKMTAEKHCKTIE